MEVKRYKMMSTNKVGQLIRTLRQEKNMTQKQLADAMNISDKAVSKWERGLGLPDISLISELSELLGVDTQSLLSGDLAENDFVGGNMRNTKYFVCPNCHNITFCTGTAEITCCGKKLPSLIMNKAKNEEALTVELIEDDWHITSEHPMEKSHYISLVAFATSDRLQIIKQYPEWNLDVRISKGEHGMLVWYCIRHGLFYQQL